MPGLHTLEIVFYLDNNEPAQRRIAEQTFYVTGDDRLNTRLLLEFNGNLRSMSGSAILVVDSNLNRSQKGAAGEVRRKTERPWSGLENGSARGLSCRPLSY